MDIRDFYKQFCSEEYDSKGRLCRFEITAADDFNFAYDAVDAIAAL